MIKKNGKTIQHIYKHIPGVLPDAYREVEYLESDGSGQYILTNVYPNANMTFSTIVAKTQNVNTTFWGCRTYGTYSSLNSQCYFSQNTRPIALYSTTADFNNSAFTSNYITDIMPNLNEFYTLNNMYCVSTMITSSYPLAVFGLNNIGSIISTPSRVKYLLVKENGLKIFEFIPCYRKADNKPGMYDVINDTFYTNAGTGEFTCGGVVKDKKILQIKDSQGRVIHRDI